MSETFEGWAVIEALGYRKLGGYLSPGSVAGAPMMRLDVPLDDSVGTLFLAPSAVYFVTPTTETAARSVGLPVESTPAVSFEALRRKVVAYIKTLPEQVIESLKSDLPSNGSAESDWLDLLVRAGMLLGESE